MFCRVSQSDLFLGNSETSRKRRSGGVHPARGVSGQARPDRVVSGRGLARDHPVRAATLQRGERTNVGRPRPVPALEHDAMRRGLGRCRFARVRAGQRGLRPLDAVAHFVSWQDDVLSTPPLQINLVERRSS